MNSNRLAIVFIVSILGCWIVSVGNGQSGQPENRQADPMALLGNYHITSSPDGKTIYLWSIRNNLKELDESEMSGYVQSFEIRYISEIRSDKGIGGGTIAWNKRLTQNPVRIFERPYLQGEEFRDARVEIENFLRLR
jgi:hypothetical protein